MQTSGPLAIGVMTRTGAAVVVGVSGPTGRPVFAGRAEALLVPDGVPRQAYHAAGRAGGH